MKDLSTLVSSVGESAPVAMRSTTAAVDLAQLVGGSDENAAMSATRSFEGIEALVGAKLQTSLSPQSDRNLSEFVDAAAEAAERSARPEAERPLEGRLEGRGWTAPEDTVAGTRSFWMRPRGQGAVSFVSVALASLAIVAVVCTTSFAVIQRTAANPADDAMVSLRDREAELRNETEVLRMANDFYTTSVADATSLAQGSAETVSALQGRVDASVLSQADSARAALMNVLASTGPAVVPEFTRAPIDEKSLADVAGALDDVRGAEEKLSPLIDSVRNARSEVTEAAGSLQNAMLGVGAAVEREAPEQLAANANAGAGVQDTFRTAVERLRTARAQGGLGLSELREYAAGLDALRADNDQNEEISDRDVEEPPSSSRTPSRNTTTTPQTESSSSPSNPEPYTPPAPEPSPSESSPADPGPLPTAPVETSTEGEGQNS